jgi:PST family polysaccharide transporter
MGTDFYPQLVGVAHQHDRCNKLVNEQTTVSLLLAGPGLIATLTLAPIVVPLLYTAAFASASEVLRWICLGMALEVVTWPMGFILVAKNRPALFLGVDLAWTVVNIGLTWLCVRYFGLAGAGMAFFASYLFHGLLLLPIAHALSGFRWSSSNVTSGLVFAGLIGAAFVALNVLSPAWAGVVGVITTLLSSAYSIRTLVYLIPPERIPRKIRSILASLRLKPSLMKTPK